MADVLTPAQRSRCMAAVKAKDNRPERLVRSILTALGYSFVSNVKDLPGQPDVVFYRRRKIIFVHGCFWHRHRCRSGRSLPSTRIDFWKDKLRRNKERDKRQLRELRHLGWQVLVIWQCQLKPSRRNRTTARMRQFLKNRNKRRTVRSVISSPRT